MIRPRTRTLALITVVMTAALAAEESTLSGGAAHARLRAAAGALPIGTLSEQDLLALVSEMTLAEKIGMIQGAPDTTCSTAVVSPSVTGCMGQAGYLPGVPRLGIPPLRFTDGPAGVKLVHVATSLPSPVGVAATFDPPTAEAFGALMGREARALNQDVLLAPMINLVSLPTGGRNFETLGEDPYLARRLVEAEVRGIQSEGMIATLKHFAMNQFENGRTTSSVEVDEQTLRETEAVVFEAGVAAGAGAVMCAYGRVDDVHACSSEALLGGLLRDAFGFGGFVVSDWGAAHTTSDLIHGLDVAMPRGTTVNGWAPEVLEAAAGAGTSEIPATNDWPAVPAYPAGQWEAAIDSALLRILGQMNVVGLLEGTAGGSIPTGGAPYVHPRPDLDTLRIPHAAIARSIAERSAALLKNGAGALPLSPGDMVRQGSLRGLLVMGPTAFAAHAGGWGSARVRPFEPMTSPWEAIVTAAGTGRDIHFVPGYDLDGEVVPSVALAAPDVSQPWPSWTLRPEDAAFSGEAGLLRQQITASAVPYGSQPALLGDPGAAPDRLDTEVDFTGAEALPPGTAWRWTGLLTVPAGGAWQLKVSVSGQESADLFIDGLEEIHHVLDIDRYPRSPNRTLFHLAQEERSHDPSLPDLQQATWSILLAAGESLHVDLRLVAEALAPASIQLRWVRPDWKELKIAEAVAAAAGATKVLVFAYDEQSEGRDRGGDLPALGLTLPGYQDELIAAVAAANSNTIVVLNTGGPHLMPWSDAVGAILAMWYPGQEGGAATASVLLGDVNPAGRTPVSFPADATHYPQFDPGCTDTSPGGNCPLYPGAATTGFLGVGPHGYRTIDFTSNGIHTGYRWHDREGIQPRFPFGHGLSYTTFEYSGLRITPRRRGGIDVRFTVSNPGSLRGEEVAQVYIGPSRQAPSGTRQPERRLVQFVRFPLEPGEAREVELYVDPRDLSVWSGSHGGWRVAGGRRLVEVGASSRDIRLSDTVMVRR